MPITPEDFWHIAERYTELISPGQWPELKQEQQAIQVRLVARVIEALILEGFMPQLAQIKIPMEAA